MPIQLFPLRSVPEDEAAEVRELLTAENIDFYETTAGNWGISNPALWLKNNDDFEKAKILLQAYQQQRYNTQRENYLQKKQHGEQKTLLKAFLEKPLVFTGYLLIVGLIIYVSVKLVFEFGLSL